MPPTKSRCCSEPAACGERRPEELEERTLPLGQPRLGEHPPERVRSRGEADRALVQVLPRPADKALIDRLTECEHPLRHASRRGDHHRRHHLRLELEHLDVPDRRRLEGRRRDECQQPRHLRQRLRRRLQRTLDLGPRPAQVQRYRCRARLEALEEALDEKPVAGLGRDPPRGRVRVGEQPAPLELRELATHGRRRDMKPGALDQVLGADRLPRGDVLLDEAPEDVPLAICKRRLSHAVCRNFSRRQ